MAKRKTNWETATAFPNIRRANLYITQGHAFDHWSGRCTNDNGALPDPPVHRDLACPVCAQVLGFNKFTEDHCPQKSGQSNFGGPSCVVLVCKACNGTPGRSYERSTASLRAGGRPSDQEIVHGAVGPDGSFRPTGMADTAEMATDQKTAFLVGFAVLGYRFALHPIYAHIRESIVGGGFPPGSGPIEAERLSSFEKDESVYEFTNGAVAVIGRGYGWMIAPIGSTSTSNRRRRWDWPESHSRGSRYDFDHHLAQDGGLFHGDFCTNPDHHQWDR